MRRGFVDILTLLSMVIIWGFYWGLTAYLIYLALSKERERLRAKIRERE